jgi:alkylhydroperoxidase/carboxymuconolactone decarboxylase family protein YurZ
VDTPVPSANGALREALCRTIVAAGRGDWDGLHTTLQSASTAAMPRAAFEETLLQAVLFFGFPRVVSAFEVLNRAWPAATPPSGGSLPRERQAAAGRELFAAIYDSNDAAVRAMLASFHREFHDFVLEAAYGRILTRPGLDPGTRELLAVAALASLDQKPQLVAHARGALRFGRSRTEVAAAIGCGASDPKQAEGLLRLVTG